MADSAYTHPKIQVLSENVLLLEWPAIISRDQHRFILHLKKALIEGFTSEIRSAVPAFHTLTIFSTDGTSSLQLETIIESFIRKWSPDVALDSTAGSLHTIPVRYGGEFGPDLEELATIKQRSPAEIVHLHTSVEYYVYMIGFLAGFPYLGGLPDVLHHPRRNEPRVRVPAGSVGIGGAQTGIYPVEAPGGWHLIGQTTTPVFQPHSRPPTAIQPGDRIRFVEVDHD